MSSLSRITNSVISGSNENTLALANFNFDFSLVKFDAPPEFAPLGSALSSQRRRNAEEGTVHQIARKVGALFEQLIPSTPKLIRTYGSRASEIIQTPGINPKGSKADGPFENFVGVDATSVWAAATSGPASLAVLLLACILARTFDDAKISTALWVDLIEERLNAIAKSVEEGEIVSAASAMAARQIFPRDQLAAFDASARAWLRSADEAKMKEKKQLELIVKNIPASVSIGPSTYSKVITAWKGAMQGLEDLLNGMPQQISDGAILLALSAWHLYPDLIVLRSKTQKVNFSDALIPPTSVITVGLESIDPSFDQGIQWSLTLSHLRYYGGPITVDVQEGNSRVTMEQLCIVVLGAFIATWNVAPREFISAVSWLSTLWAYMTTQPSPEGTKTTYRWLPVLASVASRVINSSRTELETSQMLLKFGSRRKDSFFGDAGSLLTGPERNVPFFGLCNPFVLHALGAGSLIECGVRYLRSLAQQLEMAESESIIVYTERTKESTCVVFATAVPHHSRALWSSENNIREEEAESWRHARWVHAKGSTNISSSLSVTESEQAFQYSTITDHLCQSVTLELGEELIYLQGDDNDNFSAHGLNWRTVPKMFSEPYPCFSSNLDSRCSCLKQDFESGREKKFFRFLGHESSICLFVEQKPELCRSDLSSKRYPDIQQRHLDFLESTIEPEQVMLEMKRGRITQTTLWRYIEAISESEDPSSDSRGVFNFEKAPSIMMVISGFRIPDQIVTSLEAVGIASQIYEQFPSATIPLKIVSQPVISAKWLQPMSFHAARQTSCQLHLMTRPQVFSCLAMFESGGIDINPNQLNGVMAMSAGNSIFVAEILLPESFLPMPSNAS